MRELARGWKDDPETLRMVKEECSSSDDRSVASAIQERARGWKDDPETLRFVKERASSDENGAVRWAEIDQAGGKPDGRIPEPEN